MTRSTKYRFEKAYDFVSVSSSIRSLYKGYMFCRTYPITWRYLGTFKKALLKYIVFGEELYDISKEVEYTFTAWGTYDSSLADNISRSKYIGRTLQEEQDCLPHEFRPRICSKTNNMDKLTFHRFDDYFSEINTDLFEELYMNFVKEI